MKHKHASPTMVVPVRPRRSLRWLDSLIWLAIAGTLAALLVPAKSVQTASKQTGRGSDATASTAGETAPASPLAPARDDVQEFSSGHKFASPNEADSMRAHHQAPAPGSSSAAERPTENTPDDSPRVTSGPTLNGPELGNPIPR